ncbi:polysaccharide biosynthesis/export family protein [Jannaschia pohangensis]|nr:polysaccharide biosynthesis/export family protein [Jannaschia pohangensis]
MTVSLRLVAVVVFLGTVPLVAGAETYRVIPGDVLRVTLMEAEGPEDVQIDLDGRLRVPDLGSVDVVGLTLDEVEARLDATLEDAGLVLSLNSTVSIGAYAPVVVMGDVSRPGRFDYIPGMSVATALGLSGGSRADGIDPLQIERAAAEVAEQVQITGLELAGAAAEIAGLEALRAEATSIVLSPDLRAGVPGRDQARLPDLLELESEVLATALANRNEQETLWQSEIGNLERQAALLEDRLAVQRELVAQAALNLENSETLQDRGLQTAAAITRVQQADADARARVLELESLGLAIQSNLSEARRARARFLRNSDDETLGRLRAARARYQEYLLRHARALEQQAILQGGNVASLLAAEAIVPEFRIVSPRAGRADKPRIDLETALLPGDTLVVTLDVAVPGND